MKITSGPSTIHLHQPKYGTWELLQVRAFQRKLANNKQNAPESSSDWVGLGWSFFKVIDDLRNLLKLRGTYIKLCLLS